MATISWSVAGKQPFAGDCFLVIMRRFRRKFACLLLVCVSLSVCFIALLRHGHSEKPGGLRSHRKRKYQRPSRVPHVRVTSVDCAAIIANNATEIANAKMEIENNPKIPTPEEFYANWTLNCSYYRRSRGYWTWRVSREEDNLPIAYSLIVHNDIELFERLLRAIYRPNNVYCIHVDLKTRPSVRQGIASVTSCFTNVFVAGRSVDVRWGRFSVLEAELICIRELWTYKKWRYFINLTGHEFPLKTNQELVQILDAFQGANDIDGSISSTKVFPHWLTYRWVDNIQTDIRKPPAPHKLKIYKGSLHVVASREFVDYMLYNETSLALLQWLKDVHIPDEHYFATLNHNSFLRVPGSYRGDSESRSFVARLKLWQTDQSNSCGGSWVRWLCNFGVGDLHRLCSTKKLFANKFQLHSNYLAYDCLEEWFFNKTRTPSLSKLDVSFYKDLSFVRNRW